MGSFGSLAENSQGSHGDDYLVVVYEASTGNPLLRAIRTSGQRAAAALQERAVVPSRAPLEELALSVRRGSPEVRVAVDAEPAAAMSPVQLVELPGRRRV